jgi:hypothetical protein
MLVRIQAVTVLQGLQFFAFLFMQGRQCFRYIAGSGRSRAAGAGVLRPRRRRQYRPASYSQAESKCVITNWAGFRLLARPGSSHVFNESAIPAEADLKATFGGHKTTEQTKVLSDESESDVYFSNDVNIIEIGDRDPSPGPIRTGGLPVRRRGCACSAERGFLGPRLPVQSKAHRP